MEKQELFKKYSINDSHSEWDDKIDNWISIEIYRIMHDGKLPEKNDYSVIWVCDFMDKLKDLNYVIKLRKSRKPDDFGSLYLTSKRMIYSFHEEILKYINKKEAKTKL